MNTIPETQLLITDKLAKDLQLRTAIIKSNLYSVRTYTFGHGPNIILGFPPFPHSGILFTTLVKDIDINNITFVTFDLPGWIGFSKLKKQTHFNYKLTLDIVERIKEKFQFTRFNTLGYSFGTSIAIQVAEKYKNECNKLALISPIVNSNLKSLQSERTKIILAYKLRLDNLMENHLLKRYKFYRQKFLKEGLSTKVLDNYLSLIKKSNYGFILESL